MGSFNMSKGSDRNMDSAVIMGPAPAQVYYLEWYDIFAYSEPLNFNATYVAPEWRDGT